MNRGALDRHRNAELEEGAEHGRVDVDEVAQHETDAKVAAPTPDEYGGADEADRLSNDGGKRRAKGAPLETDDEKQVEEDIEDGRYADENERMLRVAKTAQNGADHVVAVDEYQPE